MPRAQRRRAPTHSYIRAAASPSSSRPRATLCRAADASPEPKTIPMPQGEAPLTEREMEILRLMCKHMTNKEIASELYISEDTVKYHKKNMLAKTGFARSVDLAFYMISNGWINPLY